MIDFMLKTMDALNPPEKFYLSGHSYGGYMAALYTCMRPERVEKLFLASPAMIEPYDPAYYDPTQFSDPKNPQVLMTQARV